MPEGIPNDPRHRTRNHARLQGHKNSFGINNRGHRFCRKFSNDRRRLAL